MRDHDDLAAGVELMPEVANTQLEVADALPERRGRVLDVRLPGPGSLGLLAPQVAQVPALPCAKVELSQGRRHLHRQAVRCGDGESRVPRPAQVARHHLEQRTSGQRFGEASCLGVSDLAQRRVAGADRDARRGGRSRVAYEPDPGDRQWTANTSSAAS